MPNGQPVSVDELALSLKQRGFAAVMAGAGVGAVVVGVVGAGVGAGVVGVGVVGAGVVGSAGMRSTHFHFDGGGRS